jgi:hypothetical protein
MRPNLHILNKLINKEILIEGGKMRQVQTNIAAFLYHDVTDDPSESGFQRRTAMRYKQSREAFANHLDGIASGGHTPSIVSELNFRQPGKHVLLTFDDDAF